MRERATRGGRELSPNIGLPRQDLDVNVMESAAHAPCSPPEAREADAAVETRGSFHRRHIVVSEPLQRNLEAIRKRRHLHLFIIIMVIINNPVVADYPSGDQPARICHRVRGSQNPSSPSISPSSTATHHSLTRSPTRRVAASSSCPSPSPRDSGQHCPFKSSSNTISESEYTVRKQK